MYPPCVRNAGWNTATRGLCIVLGFGLCFIFLYLHPRLLSVRSPLHCWSVSPYLFLLPSASQKSPLGSGFRAFFSCYGLRPRPIHHHLLHSWAGKKANSFRHLPLAATAGHREGNTTVVEELLLACTNFTGSCLLFQRSHTSPRLMASRCFPCYPSRSFLAVVLYKQFVALLTGVTLYS